MQSIVQLVQEKAGISQDQAQKAVETVAGYLKTKLPAPIAGQIDGLLQADVSDVAGQVDDLLKGGLGGLFGGKQ